MKPEQQRIAIAEFCGWKIHDSIRMIGEPPGEPPRWGRQLAYLPDYLNSLDAMHAAEAALPENLKWKFADILVDVVDADRGSFVHVHATAEQRRKAFLLTIGKWQEEP